MNKYAYCKVIIFIQLVALMACTFGIRKLGTENEMLKKEVDRLFQSNSYLLEKVETLDDWLNLKDGKLQ